MSTVEETRSSLRSLVTRADLAKALNIPHSRLIFWVYRINRDSQYTRFAIPKKTGGAREISAPTLKLKLIQKAIANLLTQAYKPKTAVHGFLSRRSILTNATSHVRARYVLNFDIADFFPSITFPRIRGLLLKKPYGLHPTIATTIAQICTYKGGLPQGAPTSPIVSNMICAKLDSDLAHFARRWGAYYTRYADDITFSLQAKGFPKGLAISGTNPRDVLLTPELRAVIENNGFKLNDPKTRLQRTYGRQVVTGLVVNKFPNVPRRYMHAIRGMLHAWDTFGLADAERVFIAKHSRRTRYPGAPQPSFLANLEGRISYLRMIRGVDDLHYLNFKEQFDALKAGRKWIKRKKTTVYDLLRRACWVLECSETNRQGTAFLVSDVGLITCHHVVGPNTVAFHPDDQERRYAVAVLRSNAALDIAVLERPVAGPGLELDQSGAVLNYEDYVRVSGYPNFRPADQIYSVAGKVVGIRVVSTIRRLLTDAPIIAGQSGGPVLDAQNRVIGIAATGADRMEAAPRTEDHGIIPISALVHV